MDDLRRPEAICPPRAFSTGTQDATPSQKVMWLIVFIVSVAAFASYYRGSNLIDPVPFIGSIEGLAIGGFLGLILVCLVPKPDERRFYFMVPTVFAVSVAMLVPNIIETYAFWHLQPKAIQTIAPIVGGWTEVTKGNSYCKGAEILPFAGSNVITIRTNGDICHRALDTNSEKRGCILVEIQTGRRGIRRVYAPLLTYFGSNRLRTCSA